MRVRPAPGLTVRHPVTREIIPEDGITVEPTDRSVARLVQAGDVVVDDAPEIPAPEGDPNEEDV